MALQQTLPASVMHHVGGRVMEYDVDVAINGSSDGSITMDPRRIPG
jgi:hypothetical protein